MKCSQPFATPQQNEPPNPNKNHGALKNTTQYDLPERLLLPARLADEIIFAVHVAGMEAFSDRKILQIPRHCSPAQALKVAIRPAQDHLRANNHRKLVFVANMTKLHQARTCENIAHAHAK